VDQHQQHQQVVVQQLMKRQVDQHQQHQQVVAKINKNKEKKC